MKMLLLFSALALPIVSHASTAKPKIDKACKKAADESIANSRDSDATFQEVDGNEYVYGVSRGHDEPCDYEVRVTVKKHSDGTCDAGKARFINDPNCG